MLSGEISSSEFLDRLSILSSSATGSKKGTSITEMLLWLRSRCMMLEGVGPDRELDLVRMGKFFV